MRFVAKESSNDSTKLRAQSRADNSKKSDHKKQVDMNTVMQQHLIAAVTASNNDKELRDKSGSKEDKKGRLQTVGSVLGDIIGALVSEVARFFGNVVSDVAREVTAHGFVSLLKQIADFTGFGPNSGGAQPATQMAGFPQFG